MNMIKEELLELEKCLIQVKNPVLPYLNAGIPFDCKKFTSELKSLDMEPTPDLIDLYYWKSGMPEQPFGFNFNLFSEGTFIHYIETITIYKTIFQSWGLEFNKLLPIILKPYLGAEDPVMINLDEKSTTHGSILYYSSHITPFGPTLIYDSLHSMIQTIIERYRQNLYSIDENGELLYDNNNEKWDNIRKKFNKEKSLWDSDENMDGKNEFLPKEYYEALCQLGMESICAGKFVEGIGYIPK